MPTLKIGCRVDHKDCGEAMLKDFDATKAMPWLLQTSSGLVWAKHTDFCSFDTTRVNRLGAGNAPAKSSFENAGAMARPSLLSGMLNAVLRPRAHVSSHI